MEIVPEAASPPCTPETYQLTAVFVVPVTDAAKACDWPADTVAAVGEMETTTAPLATVRDREDEAVVPLESFTVSDAI